MRLTGSDAVVAASWDVELLLLRCVWNSLAYKNTADLEIKREKYCVGMVKCSGYNCNFAKVRKYCILEAKSYVLHYFFNFRRCHISTQKTCEYHCMLLGYWFSLQYLISFTRVATSVSVETTHVD